MPGRRAVRASLAAVVVLALAAVIGGGWAPPGMEGLVVIVVPWGFLEKLGYVHGVMQVSMMGVSDFAVRHYVIEDIEGGWVVADFRGVVGEWAEMLKARPGVGVVNLPTVTITLYLYDGEGRLHIATLMYSAFDYHIERRTEGDPTKLATENPLEPYETVVVIKLDPGSIEPSSMGLEAERAWSLIGLSEPPPPAPASCRRAFSQVYWKWLYETIDNPPRGWMERVVGEDLAPASEGVKRRLWRYFATEYSMAWYYSLEEWADAGEALREAARRLAPTGLYDMDGLIRVLAEKAGIDRDLSWADSQRHVEATIQAPYFAFKLHPPNVGTIKRNYVMAVGGIGVFEIVTQETGLTFMGKIVAGDVKVPRIFDLETFAATLGRKVYMIIPTVYNYLEDGFYLAYDVDRVYVEGCGYYWRVVPVFFFLPLYNVLDIRYDLMGAKRASLEEPDPPELENLLYSYDVVTMEVNIARVVGKDYLLFLEEGLGHPISGNLAFRMVNLYRPWLEATLSATLGGVEEARRVMFTLASSYLGFTDMQIEYSPVSFNSHISIDKNLFKELGSVKLKILKYTIREKAESYKEANIIPVIVMYEVFVEPLPRE
ncbi:MAG: hypothetical protein F7B17_06985 [Desulfurococcales archaeon]|nr:hypothetical protein [Desulfurococcales archaeon]